MAEFPYNPKLLLTISPKEERIIRLFYGIDCDALSMLEIATLESVTRERVRQIIRKAESKLKDEKRTERLRPFLEDW